MTCGPHMSSSSFLVDIEKLGHGHKREGSHPPQVGRGHRPLAWAGKATSATGEDRIPPPAGASREGPHARGRCPAAAGEPAPQKGSPLWGNLRGKDRRGRTSARDQGGNNGVDGANDKLPAPATVGNLCGKVRRHRRTSIGDQGGSSGRTTPVTGSLGPSTSGGFRRETSTWVKEKRQKKIWGTTYWTNRNG